jgi:hypothetical protein
MTKRLPVVIAGLVLLVGVVGSSTATRPSVHAGSRSKQATPTAALALQQEQSTPPQVTSCLDLPISSQLITPRSCWQTGPTSMLVAGTAPTLPGAGAIAVLQGQERQVTVVPDSGSLSVVEASGSVGCVQGGAGFYYPVNLDNGGVGAANEARCVSDEPAAYASATLASAPTQSPKTAAARVVASTIIPPPVAPSYYEETAYVSECGAGSTGGCPIYLQGQTTVTPSPSGIVVLDFGSPCSSGATFGTEMFYGGGCIADSTIHQLVQEWINGYASDHGSATPQITIAIGTSNSYTADDASGEPANLATSGAEWYQLVVGAPFSAISAPLSIWGASDIEQASDNEWYDGSDTLAWVEGYSAAAFPTPPSAICGLGEGGMLADFGDDILGGVGSGDGWTVNQIYDVAQGITGTCALPEIYYSANAPEWQALSQWAQSQGYPSMVFTAVMVEPGGTTECPPPNGYTLMSASCAWTTLQGDTGQAPDIPGITQIATALQASGPSVNAVSPDNGPDSGGNEVVISGSGFLGAQTVYFGTQSVALSPSAVNGPGTRLTVQAPTQTPGQVDVIVESSLGSSPLGSADEYQFDAPPCTADSVSLLASSVASGFANTVSASATCPSGANAKYSYFTRPVGASAWTLEAAWSGPSWTWATSGLSDGTYQVLVWVSDGPYSLPQAQAAADLTVAPQAACSSDTVSADPEVVLSGDNVQVTALSDCPAGSLPEYAYFIRPSDDGNWALQAAWIGPSWTMSTIGMAAGAYDVLVWVSDGPYSGPQAEGFASLVVEADSSCTADTATAPASVLQGSVVDVSATSTCPAGSSPLYSYFVSGPDGGGWSLEAAWIASRWTWSTAGLPPGTYEVLVWVSDGPYTAPQAQDAVSITVDPLTACSSVTISAPITATEGLPMGIEATGSCPTGSSPLYSYFVLGPGGGGWSLEAAWVGASWTWSTVGLPDGTYQVLVWVSDGPYTGPQAQASTTVRVDTQQPCTGVTAHVSASTVAAGQPVEVSAAGTCPAGTQPLYTYFTGTSSSGPWTLQAAWIGPTWTWDTGGLANGTYYVTVWVSGAEYVGPEASTVASLEVDTPPACTGLSAAAVPTTASSGESITVTANAVCPAGTSPLYSYFTNSPSAPTVWTLAAAWVGPSWTWSTTGLLPGDYQVLVWVSDGPYTAPQVQTIESVAIDSVAPCSGVVATAPATVVSGQPVSVDATATCPSGAQVEYSYFTLAPGSETWSLQAAWVGDSWAWNTVGVSPGSYAILVWASDGPYTEPQAETEVPATVTG